MMCDTVFDVSLPSFSGEGSFEAKLRRPSLLSLAAKGMIPNELLACARELFNEGGRAQIQLDELGRLLLIFAQASLVSPTYEEICDKGITLTDEQLSAIYAFAQGGVRALLPFCRERENADLAAVGQEVFEETQ